jgi:hypothetical protein
MKVGLKFSIRSSIHPDLTVLAVNPQYSFHQV